MVRVSHKFGWGSLAIPLLSLLGPSAGCFHPYTSWLRGRLRRKDTGETYSGSAVLSVCSGWKLWRARCGLWLWNKQLRSCVQAIRLGLSPNPLPQSPLQEHLRASQHTHAHMHAGKWWKGKEGRKNVGFCISCPGEGTKTCAILYPEHS